ncbi:MAG TPA: hypothetical protein VF845_13155 [Terriglobales bacterium]
MFGRCHGYNFHEMHFPRYLAAVIALQFVALAFSSTQTASKNSLDETIRQADALQGKGALADARKTYESVRKQLVSQVTGNPASQLTFVADDGSGSGVDDTKVGSNFTADVTGAQYKVQQGEHRYQRHRQSASATRLTPLPCMPGSVSKSRASAL